MVLKRASREERGGFSVEVRNLGDLGVRPQVVDVVILPHVGNENVDHDIPVIHGHPYGVLATGNGGGMLLAFYPCGSFDAVDNAVHLSRIVPRANDKGFSGGRRDITQIGNADTMSFLFLNAFDAKVYELLGCNH